MRLRPYQHAAVNAVFNEWYQEGHSRTLAILPTGCHAIGQKLLLSDGSVKAVENISYADRLMGADGTPRRILLRHTGNDTLFRIIPIKGEPFTVTGNHKLTLIRTGGSSTSSFPCRNKKGELIDVTVDEWMTWSKYRKHIYKLVRCSVVRQFDVETVELPIDPYFLGCLLGDGSLSSAISITTPDPEIVEVINEQAQKYGLNIRTEPAGKATTYILSSNWKRKDLTTQLNQLGLRHTKSNNKFVPSIYKTASFNERLEIIAGLLDTDGSGTGNGFDFISKSKQLADDLVFMCRSVGLAAYCKDCQKGYGTDFFATYWCVSISGDCSIIPNRVQRKKQRPRQQKKNVLVTGFSVERCASGDFIGFTVDGDNRYLLDDFTITHNCGKTIIFSEITKREVLKNHKVLILAHREELLLQAQDKLFKTTGLYAELEKGKSSTVDSETPVVIGSIQTLCRARRLNQFTPDTFDCIIIDEAHHCLSESYQRVLWYFKNAHVLGVTATPDRGDKKELAEYFNSTAYQYNLLDAIKDGYLTPINLIKLDVSIDLSNVHIKNGDYDENDLGDSIRPYLYDIALKLKANCFGRKIAVFLPLISISQEFAEIMNEMGFSAVEVNGSSPDRQEKLQAFEQGQYNVITNAMLIIEGWDCPAVDCIVVLRPTKIRSLYTQMVGRGLRLSPETGKRDCQVVDFMWLSERHDLCNASCLVCETDEQSKILQEMMSETAEIDLMTAAQEANKKLLEEEDEEPKEKGSTEDTIRQNLIKNLNILNVEQNSMLSIVNHEDIYKWEQEPASEKQIQMLEKNGFKLTNVSKGMASKIISIIIDRTKNGLATFKQVKTLKSHGLKNPEKWSMDEASRCIGYLVANSWYIEPDKLEQINEVMMRKYA